MEDDMLLNQFNSIYKDQDSDLLDSSDSIYSPPPKEINNTLREEFLIKFDQIKPLQHKLKIDEAIFEQIDSVKQNLMFQIQKLKKQPQLLDQKTRSRSSGHFSNMMHSQRSISTVKNAPVRLGSNIRLQANQSCIDLKSRISRRKLRDEEPCNVNIEEADELLSDKVSQSISMNQELNKTGNFNDLMNQIIQQYDDEPSFNFESEFEKLDEIKHKIISDKNYQNNVLQSYLNLQNKNIESIKITSLEIFERVLGQMQEIQYKEALKAKAWEKEMRSLQNSVQMKQIKIDQLDTQLTSATLSKNETIFEFEKHKKQVELLCCNFEEYTGVKFTKYQMFDTNQAIEALKMIFDQNEKMKQDIQKVVHATIQNYYDMSLNDKYDISQKIDMSILQNSQYELPDLRNKTGKSFVARYQDMLTEAKQHFLQDLETLKLELNETRQLLVQMHNEKQANLDRIATMQQENAENQRIAEAEKKKYNFFMKSNDKTKILIQKQEHEIQSFNTQIVKLEEIRQYQATQIIKMTDEIKYRQAKISQLELNLFETQSEFQRRKDIISDQEQKLKLMKEERMRNGEKMQGLEKQVKELQEQLNNSFMEEIIRDLGQWMSEYKTYNENYLENQELINQLTMNIDEEDEIDFLNMQEVAKIVKKIAVQSQSFEPMRLKLKTNIFYLDKKLQEHRSTIKNFKPKKSKSVSNISLTSQPTTNIENFNMNQDLRLKLEIVQDEKHEIEKKLKNISLKNQKIDEIKLKYENLLENHKLLKSRHLILIEQIKKHECSNSQEIFKMLQKLSSLPQISSNMSTILDTSYSSNQKNLKSQKMNSSISAQVRKSMEPDIQNLLALSESMDSQVSNESKQSRKKMKLSKFISPQVEKFDGYADLDKEQIQNFIKQSSDFGNRNFSFGPQRITLKFEISTQTEFESSSRDTQTTNLDLSIFMESQAALFEKMRSAQNFKTASSEMNTIKAKNEHALYSDSSMIREAPSPSPPVIRFNVGSEQSLIYDTAKAQNERNIAQNSSIMMPSPASSSSEQDNLEQFEDKFDKIQSDFNAERSDSILMNNLDGTNLIKMLTNNSANELERVPEEYIQSNSKRNSDPISLDGDEFFVYEDGEEQEVDLDFSPGHKLYQRQETIQEEQEESSHSQMNSGLTSIK